MSEVETGALNPGRIEPRELEQEMRSSYLDYAMSVIVGRALPDARDGLKPVHRRVARRGRSCLPRRRPGAQAGTPARALRHARHGPAAEPALRQVRPGSRP